MKPDNQHNVHGVNSSSEILRDKKANKNAFFSFQENIFLLLFFTEKAHYFMRFYDEEESFIEEKIIYRASCRTQPEFTGCLWLK